MIESPSDVISWLEPRIPSALVPREALSRVETVARTLPPARALSFECRLAEQARRVDFLVAITPAFGREELAARRLPGSPWPSTPPAWEGAADFCAEWATPGSVLHGQIPCLWLEFDLEGPAPGIPPPFVSACIQPRFLEGLLAGGPGAAGARVRQLASRSLELLGRGPPPPAIERSLAACFDHLPDQGSVMHVASSRARGTETIRLVLALPRHEVPTYLERIGWPGSPAEAQERLLSLSEFSSEVELYLDVGERVLPPLACGWSLLGSATDPRTVLLLERLVQQGLCTPGKREALAAWLGRERTVLPGMQWPSGIIREVSIKVVHRPGQPLEAKGYLEFLTALSLVA